MLGQYLTLLGDRFLPHPFQFAIRLSVPRRYIMRASDCVVPTTMMCLPLPPEQAVLFVTWRGKPSRARTGGDVTLWHT